jgi:hypothetical protein
MAAFWAVFTFGGSGPDITAHGSLDLKQEIQIQIIIIIITKIMMMMMSHTLTRIHPFHTKGPDFFFTCIFTPLYSQTWKNETGDADHKRGEGT